MRSFLLKGCLLLASLIHSIGASAQGFPSHALTLVVPFAAGGSTDILGRSLADSLSKLLGKPVIVENVPGAGTAVAAAKVAKAPPDGYTLLLASTSTLVFNPILNTGIQYDPQRDFAGVSMIASAPVVMVVNAASPAKRLEDFVQLARNAPSKLNFGSAGQGSSLHLAAELLMSMVNVDMVHIPYKGSPQALSALMNDEVQLYFDLIPTTKPLVDSGRLRALAVSSDQRLKVLPDVPTFKERGFGEFDVSPQFALVVPQGTPPAVIARLNTEVQKVLGSADLRQRFESLGLELSPSHPDAVLSFFLGERKKWELLVKKKGIQLDR